MQKNVITRKKSLEEEIKVCRFMLAFEHRTDMKNKIQVYLDKVNEELLTLLR